MPQFPTFPQGSAVIVYLEDYYVINAACHLIDEIIQLDTVNFHNLERDPRYHDLRDLRTKLADSLLNLIHKSPTNP